MIWKVLKIEVSEFAQFTPHGLKHLMYKIAAYLPFILQCYLHELLYGSQDKQGQQKFQ